MVDFNKNRCLNSIGAIHFAAPTTIRNSFDEFFCFWQKEQKQKKYYFYYSHIYQNK